MNWRAASGTAGRRALAILIGVAAVALIAVAAFRSGGKPASSSAGAPAKAPAAAVAPAPAKPSHPATKPAWADLTPAQQKALAPLQPEWDQMAPVRKTKWLAIGNKFASMSPAQQQRVQKRMSEWMQLTPQQRLVARDSYTRTKKLDQAQKSERWEQYQQLPEEQKEQLAKTTIKKRITTLPSARTQNKPPGPMKSTPQPVLEQALTPPPGGHLTMAAPPTPAAETPAVSAAPPALPAPAPPPPPPAEPAPPDPTQF